jgi:hypothetical protein
MEQSARNLKALKFRTLAEQRVSNILRTIRRVGKLSRRSTYEYTPDQVEKMFRSMRQELDAAEHLFAPEDRTEPSLFTLD